MGNILFTQEQSAKLTASNRMKHEAENMGKVLFTQEQSVKLTTSIWQQPFSEVRLRLMQWQAQIPIGSKDYGVT